MKKFWNRLGVSFTLVGLIVAQLSFGPLSKISAETSQITDYYIPIGVSSFNNPKGIVQGPDGQLWFQTGSSGGSVFKVTTSGDFSTSPFDFVLSQGPLTRIAPNTDGSMWGLSGSNSVTRVMNNTSVEYTLGLCTQNFSPDTSCNPLSITQGPDGNMWVTEDFSPSFNQIASITSSGTVTNYHLPVGVIPSTITNGPDGALWFTAQGNGDSSSVTLQQIGRITVSGQETMYTVSEYSTYPPVGITSGPDGALWFNHDNAISRITTAGSITDYPLPSSITRPTSLTFGPDGALWFGSASSLARMQTDGTFSLYIPTSTSNPPLITGVTVGPDNAIWFTETNANRIGRINVPAPNAPTNLNIFSPTNAPNLTWNAVSSAFGYNIYRNGAFVTHVSTTSFNDSAAPEGTSSYYVTAVIGTLESTPSNTVNVLVDKTAPVLGSVAWAANTNPVTIGQSASFTVSATDTLSGITKGEYYIGDTDPGQGNATSTQWDGTNLSATLGSNLTTGVYDIHIRAQDNAGNWSVPATTLLVVYNPSGPGVTGKNSNKNLIPSLTNCDTSGNCDKLPGLINTGQTDVAQYGFTVGYKTGAIDRQSDFHIVYATGGNNCDKKLAANCHSFELNADSISWLVIDGTNNSHARFQGSASVVIDGVTTTNPFTADVTDGDLVSPATNDTVTFKVYAPSADISSAQPLYRLSGSFTKGISVTVR